MALRGRVGRKRFQLVGSGADAGLFLQFSYSSFNEGLAGLTRPRSIADAGSARYATLPVRAQPRGNWGTDGATVVQNPSFELHL